jgi:hypothetical protein
MMMIDRHRSEVIADVEDFGMLHSAATDQHIHEKRNI